jgi:TonB family protein
MKNISKTANTHSQKENRSLSSLLFVGFVGSTCIHAAVMIAPVTTLWKPASNELDDTIEVSFDTTQVAEDKTVEAPKETIVTESVNNVDHEALQSVEAARVAIALAPEDVKPLPLKEGKDTAAPDTFKPLVTATVSDTKIQTGGGAIIAKDGTGSGFGNAKTSTGFMIGGKINGKPNGSKNGTINGVVNGSPNGKGTKTSAVLPSNPLPLPSQPSNNPPPKLECLSCPKPQYRGKEGTPRVTYDIAPDGSVTNVRLRQSSGDAQTDRETIEAMSKWQFNPQTIPEQGRANVKVRVTFEEDGSKFQRENEARRRQESAQLAEQQAAQLAAQQSEQTRLAEESRQREEKLAKPTTVTAPVISEPVPSVPSANPIAPVEPVVSTDSKPTP